MDNVVAFFMKEVNEHWKTIAATLRATGYNPMLCLEAARSRTQGMHHDNDLATAFNTALSDAKNAAMQEKLEKKKTRYTRAS
jgi:hypothetical protein